MVDPHRCGIIDLDLHWNSKPVLYEKKALMKKTCDVNLKISLPAR
jgi:hypothetical protein